MPRNMSFALTTKQILDQSKTVTRRFGWGFLKPGDVIYAVEKSMGLKKGEKINRLATLRIVSIRQEPLNEMQDDDLAREGFPHMSKSKEFVEMIMSHYKIKDCTIPVNRIEFEYV